MADGQHFEVAKAYVTIVPSMEGSQKTIANEMGATVEPASKEVGEKSGKHLGESIAKGLKTATAVIGGALATATAGAVATGKAFVKTANDISAMGDSIGDNAAKMGISTKAYQEWDFVFQRAGTSIDALKSSMKKLNTAMVEGSDAWAFLDLDPSKFASTEEALDATIKALQECEDESLRMNLASELLGKGAIELGGIFDMTAEETEQAKQKMYELGAYMSEEAISASDKYQDTMADLQSSITGLKTRMVSDFLPGLTSVMDGLSKVFSGNGGIEEIQSGLQSVISNITSMAPQFFALAGTIINSLISGFAPMLPSLVSSIFGFLQTGLLTLTQLIPQLTPVITEGVKGVASALMVCLPVLISALIDMTKELVTWLASGDNVKNFIDGIFQIISTIAMSLADSLETLIPAVINICGQIVDSLTSPKNLELFIKTVLYIIGAVVVALAKALPEIGGVIVKSLVNFNESIGSWGKQLVGKIAPWLASVWSGIKDWFGQLPTKLSEAFKTGKETILGWGKQAITWGSDMIKNFIDGIKKKAKDLGNAIKNLAKDYIAKFLHFSVPDAGPLADADTWMPDFVDLMTTGLEKSAPKMQSAVEDFAGGMSASITANGTNGTLLGGSTYNGGAVTINVYGAEGQNINDLAKVIAQKLEVMTARKRAVYD